MQLLCTQVQIDALNDSKLIGISVYNVVILCTICLAVSLIINDPSTLYIFIASIVLFCTTLTLLTIFVPKVRFAWIFFPIYKFSWSFFFFLEWLRCFKKKYYQFCFSYFSSNWPYFGPWSSLGWTSRSEPYGDVLNSSEVFCCNCWQLGTHRPGHTWQL